MRRVSLLCALMGLGACAKNAPAVSTPTAPRCDGSPPPPAAVEARYDKARDATVLRVMSKTRPFCGDDTSLVAAASFRGKQTSAAPSELTIGLLSRARAFRLATCNRLVIEVDGRKTTLLAERLGEIGLGGVLREYVLGPMPIEPALSLADVAHWQIRACGVTHDVRPDENAAYRELLHRLGAR